MKQANLIEVSVEDPKLKPLLKENNQSPVQTKSLLIKFKFAKISEVVIKLNQKPRNIIAKLCNLSQQSTQSNQYDLEYIKLSYVTNENQKVIYCSSVNTNQVTITVNIKLYTNLLIKLEQNDVAFYSIQLYGQEQAPKAKQSFWDNFFVQPLSNGTPDHHTNNKDQEERRIQEMNKIAQKEKMELEKAVENSFVSAKYEQINQKQIIESIKDTKQFQQRQVYQFQEDEQMSQEILMENNDLQKYQYGGKKQPQVRSENFGYTDKNSVPDLGFKGNAKEKQGQNSDDQIKIHFMTKYKADDINQAFMRMHQLLEETGGAKRVLKNVMYN
ncbi:unnamed protein product (macronuclear) [Paramecium tetraurelia]|uniref:Uncharacterized protein n=1 Tax=Paramecium tetraurelia TaxID=5888 RepID=A0EIN1_PARTE|nr:uncharacterized protein GSPATT00027501001 [Paramecium tetraurelia]CAK95172.1 unnamed protein product [Paramecium tetraurelia]|eukprot:XP_001462545.1 hypothetical protein (macronuclear) [Paramecium tetraurelia strain d4-2]